MYPTKHDFDPQRISAGVERPACQLQADPEWGSSSHHQGFGTDEALRPVLLLVLRFLQVNMLNQQICK